MEDLALALLLSVIGQSTLYVLDVGTRGPEVAEHWRYLECTQLAADQWKIEARRMFQISSAQMQFNLLDTVRGVNHDHAISGVLPQYKGICKTDKFKSDGWKDISVVAFIGSLLLATLIGLACVASEDGRLWLTIWGDGATFTFAWTIETLRTLLANARKQKTLKRHALDEH